MKINWTIVNTALLIVVLACVGALLGRSVVQKPKRGAVIDSVSGTTSNTYQIGFGGPTLFNDGGAIEVRSDAGALATLRAANGVGPTDMTALGQTFTPHTPGANGLIGENADLTYGAQGRNWVSGTLYVSQVVAQSTTNSTAVWFDINTVPTGTGSNTAATTATISATANYTGGSGVCATGCVEITTSGAHGWSSNYIVTIAGTTGTVEANGAWVITVIDTTHFTIPVAYANAWISGGTCTNASNVIALYNSTGTFLTATGDLNTNSGYTGASGLKNPSWATPVAVTYGQSYWIAALYTSTYSTPLATYGFGGYSLLNVGITNAASLRWSINGTSLTRLPASITPSSNSAGSTNTILGHWFAISWNQNSQYQLNFLGSTGQSLSTGGNATPVLAMDTTQPYNNVVLYDSLGLASGYVITNPAATTLSLTALVAPERTITTAGDYPNNIDGESVDVDASNTVTMIAKTVGYPDYVVQTSNTGRGGEPMSYIQKGGSGPSYAATLYEATAGLYHSPSKSYGARAILLTHGEQDAAIENLSYGSQMVTLQQNYQTDLQAITKQTTPVPLIFSQQQSKPVSMNGDNFISQQMLSNYLASPTTMILSGPKYQYDYCNASCGGVCDSGTCDGTHLSATGTAGAGEKYAEVYWRAVEQGGTWVPLYPVSFTRNSNVVTVSMSQPIGLLVGTASVSNVPQGTASNPLVFDSTFTAPHQSGDYAAYWSNGGGFEAYDNVLVANSWVSGSPWTIGFTTAHNLATGQVIGHTYEGSGGSATTQKLFTITYVDSTHVTLNGTTPSTNNLTSSGSATYGSIWQPISITSAVIQNGNQIVLTLSRAPTRNLYISYAHTVDAAWGVLDTGGADYRRGQLRDQDPFIGRSGQHNYNWCIEFSIPVAVNDNVYAQGMNVFIEQNGLV
jgi:hypothetical protein